MRHLAKFFMLMGAVALLLPHSASAFPVTFNSTSGPGASVTFNLTGSDLTVTLTNTASTAAPDQASMLSGVYFDISSSPTLTKGSATATEGVIIPTNTNSTTGNMNGHWAFKGNIAVSGYGAYGVSGAGLNPPIGFGGKDLFSCLAPPNGPGCSGGEPDGPAYLIAPSSGVSFSPSAQNAPLVLHTMQFVLHNFAPPSATISDVSFQYGTIGTDLHAGSCQGNCQLTATPEPLSLAMFGVVVVALGRGLKRRLAV